jgi:hypothetical protein
VSQVWVTPSCCNRCDWYVWHWREAIMKSLHVAVLASVEDWPAVYASAARVCPSVELAPGFFSIIGQ